MGRDLFIAGECLVRVKGAAGSTIASLSELGLSEDPITVSVNGNYDDVHADAWGSLTPFEVQYFLSDAYIDMTLVQFDQAILEACIVESQGGANLGVTGPGIMPRAGTRLGNNAPRFNALNHYIGLNITSPVNNQPWRFFTTYMPNLPDSWPIGTKRSVVRVRFRCIPYTQDPWNGGVGAAGTILWDRQSDT